MTISVGRFVPVEPAVVWDLLVDSSRWADWGPSITDVDVPDVWLRSGTTGRVRTALGVWVPFAVTDFDEGHAWSWTVAGVPATTHTVEYAPGGCRVAFGIPTIVAPYAMVCRVALRRIDRLARATTTP